MRREPGGAMSRIMAVAAIVAAMAAAANLANAAEKLVLQLHGPAQFEFAGYYAALWKGFYDEAGLTVEIKPGETRTGTGRGAPPELLYSLMREESGFRTDVVSIAGARGLLQLMPETAERLARTAPIEGFTTDDLFDPRINVRLGAQYFADLLRQFAGRTSAAIGSYNAGPHVVVRWAPESSREDDEWVEEIPYEETRAYVKRVLRSAQAYRACDVTGQR